MLIGNGVFPNVYVDNIIIYDHEVRFDVFVLDSEEQPVWSNKEHLRGKLQIKIYCPINEQVQSNSIVLGESSFTKMMKVSFHIICLIFILLLSPKALLPDTKCIAKQ
jgi:hypothetical protein